MKQASIFGRVGQALGQGLAETVPKEVERYRLKQGLEALEKDAPNLSPTQQFSRALTVPGLIDRPQAIQSLGELYRQEGVSNSLMNRPKGINISNGDQQTNINTAVKSNPNQSSQTQNQPNERGQTPPKRPSSLTTVETEQAALNPVMPWTPEQEKQRAGELLNQDPGYYQGNYQKALDDAKSENAYRVSENQIKIGQHGAQTAGTKLIDDQLQKRAESLGVNLPGMKIEGGVQIPAKPYNEIREKAIEAVQNGKMTAADAGVEAGEEFDKLARKYQQVKDLGTFLPLIESAKSNKNAIKHIKNYFKETGETKNLADTLVKGGHSWGKAYYMANPPSDQPELNKKLESLPELFSLRDLAKFPQSSTNKKIEDPIDATNKIAEEVASLMVKTKGSPLAVSEVLNSKGYDGNTFLQYVRDNREKLKIDVLQDDELGKTQNNIPTWQDFWLFRLSGLDDLLE